MLGLFGLLVFHFAAAALIGGTIKVFKTGSK